MLGKAITVLSLPMVRQPAESHIRSWAVMPIKVWNGDRAVAVHDLLCNTDDTNYSDINI